MSNVCCKEFKGWCKAFTRTERLLTILEAILLGILIALLVFVVVHLMVCGGPAHPEKYDPNYVNNDSKRDETTTYTSTTVAYQTFPPNKTCSWKPSEKTSAPTHYYYDPTGQKTSTTRQETTTTGQETTTSGQETTTSGQETTTSGQETTTSGQETTTTVLKTRTTVQETTTTAQEITTTIGGTTKKPPTCDNKFEDLVTFSEQSDGEESPESYQRFILALVKFGPGRDETFGCILTAVSPHWAVTAASCVQAIELGDSLDAYVMVEGWGARAGGRAGGGGGGGRRHLVVDSQEHPGYRGADAGRDLAALRSADRLLSAAHAVRLPNMIDFFMTTIGENLTVLGFGRFRTAEEEEGPRQLRHARVWSLPRAQCPPPAPAPAWAARHLSGGRAVPDTPCAAAAGALCCGVRYTRGLPCNYCGGTPLLGAGAGAGGGAGAGAGQVLYGVMSDSRQCGEACEPALYVNVAAVRDWLDAVIAE